MSSPCGFHCLDDLTNKDLLPFRDRSKPLGLQLASLLPPSPSTVCGFSFACHNTVADYEHFAFLYFTITFFNPETKSVGRVLFRAPEVTH